MTRIDTIESQKVYDELKAFENSINWDGNRFIGNLNTKKFAITPAMSTRSIYVSLGDWDNPISIRISDHQTGIKSAEKDFYFTFENFDINKIKELYNN